MKVFIAERDEVYIWLTIFDGSLSFSYTTFHFTDLFLGAGAHGHDGSFSRVNTGNHSLIVASGYIAH
jgi:hypothetical protein